MPLGLDRFNPKGTVLEPLNPKPMPLTTGSVYLLYKHVPSQLSLHLFSILIYMLPPLGDCIFFPAGIKSRGKGLSPPRQWQSAPQTELAAGAPHPSLHLKLPVREPEVLQTEPNVQREVRAVISVILKMEIQARRYGGAQNKQLQMAKTALLGRVT